MPAQDIPLNELQKNTMRRNSEKPCPRQARKPNANERRRIDLIVRVDSAVTEKDKTALLKLKRECAEIPYLAKQIETALEG